MYHCLQCWQIFVQKNQQERDVKQQKQDKASKMAAFLHAAATGKLWSQNENINKDNMQRDKIQEQNGITTYGNKNRHKIDTSNELLIESVEDQELFNTDRQVVSIILISLC